MSADSGCAVERPDDPGRLHTQRGEGWRLLLGAGRYGGLPEQTQHAAHHPLARVQTGGLRVLPQPEGEIRWTARFFAPLMSPNRSVLPTYRFSFYLIHLGPHFVLCLKLLRCGKQSRSLREVGSRPRALYGSVSGKQHDQRTHCQAKVGEQYLE